MKRSGLDTRAALLLGVAAAPAAALADAPQTAFAERFVAPPGPVVLTRTLRRPLAGDAVVVSRRRYQLQFVPEAGGFRIDGELLSAEVEAPASLSMLAQIERNRPDTGMFPMRLDVRGKLLPGRPVAADASVDKAVGVALGELRRARLVAARRAEAEAFAMRLGAGAGYTLWPTDLFHPRAGHTTRSQDLALAGSAPGHVQVDTQAVTQGDHGWLGMMRRTVVTEIGGDVRQTIEEWTLELPDRP